MEFVLYLFYIFELKAEWRQNLTSLCNICYHTRGERGFLAGYSHKCLLITYVQRPKAYWAILGPVIPSEIYEKRWPNWSLNVG